MVLFLLALPALIDAAPDRFLEDVYKEINKRRSNLPDLRVDRGLENILQRLGYNGDGHDHSQVDNLQAHAERVSGKSGSYDPSTGKAKDFLENWAYTGNYKHTAKSLLDAWMASSGHRRTILDSKFGHVGCGIGKKGRDHTYTCAFIRPHL